MANTIKPKRRSADGTAPTTANLVDGEMAFNSFSKTIYLREGANIVNMFGNLAPLASPALTGTPTAPTQLTADNSTALATTAWVKNQGYSTSGGGTVTAIGVTTANGVSGTSSGGATPSLTISLGAITPTTVNGLTLAPLGSGFQISGGTISRTLQVGSDATVSGTNTGDQTSVSGNAGTATVLQTARTFTIGATGKSFDGSGNVAWTLTEIGAAPTASPTFTGVATFNSNIEIKTVAGNIKWYDRTSGVNTFIEYADANILRWHDPVGAVDRMQLSQAGKLTLASKGLATPAVVGASNTDFSNGIELFGSGIGFGVTASRVNYGTGGAGSHRFMLGGTDYFSVTTAGLLDVNGLELGFKDIPRVTGGVERGKMFATAAGFTINTATTGYAYSVYNDSASAITITQGAGLTLRLSGTATTGNRTLAARGTCLLWFNSATECIASGDLT